MKNLISGSYFVGKNPSEWIVTSLGSCIAICVYDKKLKLGGICHFVLPDRMNSPVNADKQNGPWHYGEEAIPLLLKQFKEKGSQKDDLEISIVGACDLKSTQLIRGKSISALNAECAKILLLKMGFSIHREKMGNCPSGIQLKFNLGTGQIYLKENIWALER